MTDDRWLKPCTCGFGPGWYHQDPDTSHEYNPEAPEEKATRVYEAQRRPIEKLYGHIDGPYCQTVIKVTDGYRYQNFKYKDYGDSRANAFRVAAEWIMRETGHVGPVQLELF